jgi:hypothetical protein
MFIMAFAALASVLASCQVRVSGGPPYRDGHAPAGPPPATLAILPTSDGADQPDVARALRQSFWYAGSELFGGTVEPRQVDSRLATLASRLDIPPDRLDAAALAHPSIGDLVLFSRVEQVDRLYMLIYARLKVKVSLSLADTRTRRILYRNDFTIVDPLGGPAFSILGMLERLAVAMYGKQPPSLEQTLNVAARQMLESIPSLKFDRAAAGDLRLIDIHVERPDRVLRAGDAIVVRVEATAGCRAEATFPPNERARPLRETAPGVYEGSYRVRPRDDTPYGIVGVRLASRDDKQTLEYAAAEFALSIDTTPPPPVDIVRWWPDESARSGVFLEIQAGAKTDLNGAEIPARYLVQRREVNETARTTWLQLGWSREPIFHDQSARRGRIYEYVAIAEDAAGNHSTPSETVRLQLRK